LSQARPSLALAAYAAGRRFRFDQWDVPAALRLHPEALECDPDEASFFLGRETPVPSLRPHLSAWQQRLYAFMTRNAVSAPDYFLIPSARVVELGTRVEM
jgi:KUP system potassium uptake protein